jgi:hypothetical protein
VEFGKLNTRPTLLLLMEAVNRTTHEHFAKGVETGTEGKSKEVVSHQENHDCRTQAIQMKVSMPV